MAASRAHNTEPTDLSALIDQARSGDKAAFSDLIRTHDHKMRGLAFQLTGNQHAMDDVLQEAYLKAYRAMPRFRGDSAFGTWLYRIVYNSCIDYQRASARRDAVSFETVGDLADPQAFEDQVADAQTVAQALRVLPPGYMAAIVLVDAEGLSYTEAGSVLGVPVGTVASRLNRARASIRRASGYEDQTR